MYSGAGRLTSEARDWRRSRRPVRTAYAGPPASATASLVARISMSEHETTPGHLFSSSALMAAMRS